MITVLLLCATAQLVPAHVKTEEECFITDGKKMRGDDHLNVTAIQGLWWPLYVIPKNMTDTMNCWYYTMKVTPRGDTDAQYSYYDERMKKRHTGRAIMKKVNDRFRFYHTDDELIGEYYRLATDNRNYIINGGCPKGWPGVDRVLWIDFRSQIPTPAALAAAEAAVKELGLEMSDFSDLCVDKSHYEEF